MIDDLGPNLHKPPDDRVYGRLGALVPECCITDHMEQQYQNLRIPSSSSYTGFLSSKWSHYGLTLAGSQSGSNAAGSSPSDSCSSVASLASITISSCKVFTIRASTPSAEQPEQNWPEDLARSLSIHKIAKCHPELVLAPFRAVSFPVTVPA